MPTAGEPDGVNLSPQFGPLLRRLRTDRGWSLRDLAERIRFNRGYIGKIEQVRSSPNASSPTWPTGRSTPVAA